MMLPVDRGQKIAREEALRKLVEIQYERNDDDFTRGTFRVRGDIIDVYPSYEETGVRFEMFGDEIEEISSFDPLTGKTLRKHDKIAIFPKTHFVAPRERTKLAASTIKEELAWYRSKLESEGKLLEAQRLHQRTMFDLEMMREIGYCHGIENYARHLTGRAPGEPPPTLLDYLPKDALIIVDESHQTVPQIRGMYHGDRSRKEVLVAYGFRLPSALDNRPLNFDEWEARVSQVIFVSATPGPYELAKAQGEVVEQIIRTTCLIDPPIEVRPVKGQVDDLPQDIRDRAERRRVRQRAYNDEHGIPPESVIRSIDEVLSSVYERDYSATPALREPGDAFRTLAELDAEIARLQLEMKAAAANLDFERAASLR